MALTTIANLATGDTITESWVDSVTLNANQHKDFAEGTTPFPGSIQKFANDSNFYVQKASNIVYLGMDAGDGFYFNRTTNAFNFYVGGVEKFVIDASGLIQTAAFTSTEQAITNGSTANVAHGFASIPRWVFVRYATASGALSAATRVAVPSYVSFGSQLRIEQVGGTNVVLINNTGATVYAYVLALL